MIRTLALWLLTSPGEFFSLLGTHPSASRSFHKWPSLLPFFLPLGNLSIAFPCCTRQIRLSGHYRDLYIKNYFCEDFCISFFYLFSMAWGESWQTVNLIWSCCPRTYFGFPVKIYVTGDNILPSDRYCIHPQIPPVQPYVLFLNKSVGFFAIIYKEHEKTYLESWILYG